MDFAKLRLTGFKSFVEPAEIEIRPGMTGIVGPNGCGKSNLVEALRWVMGETSARKMRGGGMDDVIFAGSATRPARNLAEVVVTLDNGAKNAPAAFNMAAELQISRRIKRESGSDYRINGAPVRARDVQLLFADMASGARSTSIVSQNRVGALINARPSERRMLLEEAAGIRGLHSRRHEAELRLKAAEKNLERLDDVSNQLTEQLSGLAKQAKQAVRYRNLSVHIRQAEAIVHHLNFTVARDQTIAARKLLDEADRTIADATAVSAKAATRQAEQAASMDPLRKAEAEAAARAQALLVKRDSLQAEAKRIRDMISDFGERLKHADADIQAATGRRDDANRHIAELQTEHARLAEASNGQQEQQAQAAATLNNARQMLEQIDQQLTEATAALAGMEAERKSIRNRQAEQTAQQKRIGDRKAETERNLDALKKALADTGEETARSAEQSAERNLNGITERLEETGHVRQRLEQETEAAQSAAQQAKAALATLQSELTALRRVVAAAEQNSASTDPVLAHVTIDAGYETAFAAALGDDAQAGQNTAETKFWRPSETPRDAALYANTALAGLPVLADHVTGPAVLSPRLKAIAIVEDNIEGDRLAPTLAPGQRLVSRDGAIWRWDGFHQRAGTGAAMAEFLVHKNRLASLSAEEPALSDAQRETAEILTGKRDALYQARASEQSARQDLKQAESNLNRARAEMRRLSQENETRRGKLAAAEALLQNLITDAAEAEEKSRLLSREWAALPDAAAAETRLQSIRSEQVTARQTVEQAREARDRVEREIRFRHRRSGEIEKEVASWQKRSAEATGEVEHLTARRDSSARARQDLVNRPDEITASMEQLEQTIAEAETARKTAADRLADASVSLAEADRGLKTAEADLANARENRARRDTECAHAVAEQDRIAREIQDEMECPPANVLQAADLEPDASLPPLDEISRKLERLKRERANMGPVNLRAEIEVEEVGEKLKTLTEEREDLETAIAKLRQGIASLNREARTRLLDAFEKVDGHFQILFRRVFGGGEARLALEDAEDPLQAGLDIMASPPGKRMQTLSLLSGGEQALTAIALLFAVFLTNPAPICVMDEVDAPLDDANVERLMAMLTTIAGDGDTRFLVVTHNPITMARMDRLYGVTMAERGVSQLVSVDLMMAAEMRETAQDRQTGDVA